MDLAEMEEPVNKDVRVALSGSLVIGGAAGMLTAMGFGIYWEVPIFAIWILSALAWFVIEMATDR